MDATEGIRGDGDRLPARVALVTGGAGGIGRAVAGALSAGGMRVAIGDLSGEGAEEAARELADRGGEAIGVGMDVTDPESVAAAAVMISQRLGEVDVLVSNAGWDELWPFVETGEGFWRRVVEINYLGALRVTHQFVPSMIERGFGRIVYVASDAGRVGSSLEAVYAGAKGGVIAFSKSLAREVARKGVTVNVVAPGPTDTPLLTVMGEQEGRTGFVDALIRAVPMKRLAQPHDIAVAVDFFCSDQTGYITGQTLSVSGGLTMV